MPIARARNYRLWRCGGGANGCCANGCGAKCVDALCCIAWASKNCVHPSKCPRLDMAAFMAICGVPKGWTMASAPWNAAGARTGEGVGEGVKGGEEPEAPTLAD